MCILPFNAPSWPFNARFFQNGALKGQIDAAKGLVKLPSAARAAMPIEVELSWNFIYGIWYRWCWWSHESALLSGHDKLTTHLFKLQEAASFLQLETTEQLDVLLMAVYLRNPPFPERNWHALFSFLPSGHCQSCGCNTCKMDSGLQSSS